MGESSHGASCSIVGCTSNTFPYKVGNFTFPKDQRRKAWISFLSRYQPYDDSETGYICSQHFTFKDFTNIGQYRMGFAKRLCLTNTAVPSVHPRDPDSCIEADDESSIPEQRPTQQTMTEDYYTKFLEKQAEITNKSSKIISAEGIIQRREVDMIHSSVMMRTMYLQRRRDWCCDCSILIPYEANENPPNRLIPKYTDSDEVEYYQRKSGYEFKAHSCVLAVASEKIRKTLNKSGVTTIVVNGIKTNSMLSFIEIVYLGKLKDLMKVHPDDIRDIYRTAESLNSPLVKDYLERECPHIVGDEQQTKNSTPLMTTSNTGSSKNSLAKTNYDIIKRINLSTVKVKYPKKMPQNDPEKVQQFKVALPDGLALLKGSQETVAVRNKRQPPSLDSDSTDSENEHNDTGCRNEYDKIKRINLSTVKVKYPQKMTQNDPEKVQQFKVALPDGLALLKGSQETVAVGIKRQPPSLDSDSTDSENEHNDTGCRNGGVHEDIPRKIPKFEIKGGQSEVALVDFISELSDEMAENGSEERAQGPSASDSFRLTGRHLIEAIPSAKEGGKSPQRRCRVCSHRDQKKREKEGTSKRKKRSIYWCAACHTPLCVHPCFQVYHTKKRYWE